MYVCDGFSVRDDRDPNLFYTLAKVGTGYSVSELRELRQRLQPAVLSVRAGQTEFAHLPDWTLNNSRKFRPDVLYDPHKSVVLQFKCGVRSGDRIGDIHVT